MKRLLPVIFSLLVVFVSRAQEDSVTVDGTLSVDNISLIDDTVAKDSTFFQKAKPMGASLFVDYGKLLTLWTDFESKYEGGLSLVLYETLEINAEVGHATLNPEDGYLNGDYKSKGLYYRLGLGYTRNIDLKNRIGVGFKYAVSSFEDEGIIRIEGSSGLILPYERSYTRSSLDATWWEVVVNSDTKIQLNKNNPDSWMNEILRVGFQFRYRILQSYNSFEPIDVYAIPGYGKSVNRRFPAVNFYLRFNLL